MVWLHSQGLKPKFQLIPDNLTGRNYTVGYFLDLFDERKRMLLEKPKMATEFKQEMRRFLSLAQINQTLEQENLWAFVIYLIEDFGSQLRRNIGQQER